MSYVGKQKGSAELRKICKERLDEINRLKFIIARRDERLKEVRAQAKIRYEKLRWKYFKLSQVSYGKDMEIAKINRRKQGMHNKWIKRGYQNAMKRVRRTNYRVKGLSRFMFHMGTVMEIYKLTLEEYSFIMWAGMYDFFDKRDFDAFNRGVDVRFYVMIRKMINKGYVVVVGTKNEESRKVFSLTGVGMSLYNKIAKFTNKFLIDAGTSDIRSGVQDTSGPDSD
jgi:hypothetical protein